jgi:hypothetical protein
MPALSEFTPLGLLDLTDAAPLAETIHDALWASLNAQGARNFAGPYHEARVKAWAIQLATAYRGAQRVEAQVDPQQAYELLPAREAEYGVVVPVTATLTDRRGTLAATIRLALGDTYSNVRQALVDLLGADFVGLREIANSELVVAPSDPTTGPANFVLPGVARKTHKIPAGISTGIGGLNDNNYATVDGSPLTESNRFRAGEWVVIEPEIPGQAERALITHEDLISGANFRVLAVRSHEPGCLVTTMPFPYWTSTKRTCLVQLSPTAAVDPGLRRKVDLLMARVSRAVSTWAVVGSAGPLTLDSPTLGILDSTPLGAI